MKNPFTIAKLSWMGAAFLVAFLAVGIPYWSVPYNKVALPDTLLGLGLGTVGLGALVVRIWGGVGLLMSMIAVGASVPAAVIARVLVETNHDPTSHNLWPFEVVFAALVGFGCSGLGALIGTVYVMLTKRD